MHTLKCYTALDPKELHSGPITRVRFAATGLVFGMTNPILLAKRHSLKNTLATASMDGTIRLYDTVTSKQTQVLTVGCPVSSIEFSKNSKYILSCSADSIGRLWDLSTGQVRVQYHGAMQAMGNTTLNFSQSETLVIGADENSYAILLWDAVSGKIVKKLVGQAGKTRAFAVSPTRNMFVSCSDDGKAKVWECLS